MELWDVGGLGVCGGFEGGVWCGGGILGVRKSFGLALGFCWCIGIASGWGLDFESWTLG